MQITTLSGRPVSCLGLAALPRQESRCVRRAFERGVNYFFFYGPGNPTFLEGLAPLFRTRRDDLIVATGSGSRSIEGLSRIRKKLFKLLDAPMLDVFFAEYVSPHENQKPIFDSGGVLDELQKWKRDGLIRYVGVTAHHRGIAKRVATDQRVDILMHRFNMAHRKAAVEVFPAAEKSDTPIVAFTATRWGTLLEQRQDESVTPPTAADCYRFCLSYPAVKLVLTAPKTVRELNQNLNVLEKPKMAKRERVRWERYGDLVYDEAHAFETRYE